jgi:type IX secretion system PorP/SprF family membrane protein
MKKYILTAIWVISIMRVYAQQDPMFSQYWVNSMILSPTHAGADSRTMLNITGRHQWINVDGAPQTYTLSLGGKINDKVGVGVSYIHDKIGFSQTNTINADMNYHLKLTQKWSLISGIRMTGLVNTLNLANVETVQSADPLFSENLSTGLKPNVGFGFMLTSDKFYAGYSQPRTLNYDFSKSANINTQIIIHRFMYAGYNFNVRPDYKLRPSVLVKEVANAPLQMDINLVNEFNEKLLLGISARTNEGVGAMVGFMNIHRMNIYYCYDYPLSAISMLSKQTHQITIEFNLSNKPTRINSPRYFN